MKDWTEDAADEISERISNTQRPGPWFKTVHEARTWVREVIKRHARGAESESPERVKDAPPQA